MSTELPVESLTFAQQGTVRSSIGATPTIWGAEKLKKFQSWKSLQDHIFNFCLIGDSFTQGPYYVQALRELLLADGYADGGPGHSGFGWNSSDIQFRNKSANPAELDYTATVSDWVKTYGDGGHGAGCEHIVATAADKVISITTGAALSKLDIFWLNTGAGWEYQIDGGGYSTGASGVDHGGAVKYLSNFLDGIDNWSILQRCTTAGAATAGGRDGCLQVTSTSGSGRPQISRTGTLTPGNVHTIQAEIFIPSTNSVINKVCFVTHDNVKIAESFVTVQDQWKLVTFEYDVDVSFNDYLRFSGVNDAEQLYFTVPDGDDYFIRNVEVRDSNGNTVAMSSIDLGNEGSSSSIDIKSLGNTTTMLGMVGRTVNNGSLCLHRLGNSGGNAGYFAGSTLWPESVALLNPSAAAIMFGTNEQNGETPPATYATNVQTIINRLRAIDPNVDLIIACPGPTQYGNDIPKTYSLSQYRDQAFGLAKDNSAAFVDFSEIFGPWSTNLVTGGFVHVDNVHPGTRGAKVYSNTLKKVLS